MISQFRGVEYGLTNFSAQTPVISASSAFTKILATLKHNDKKVSMLELIASGWQEIIQPMSAEVDCWPIKLCDKGVLWLAVSNSIIRTKIQFASQSIVEKANAILGRNYVSSITCKLCSTRKSDLLPSQL